MDCSIIVPCRNEIRHIQAFLASLAAQDFGGLSWEALIADGASTDGTTEVLREFSRCNPHVKVLENHSRFVSAGLNLAIHAATGRYIIRLDVHATYAPDYCRTCIETLRSTGAVNVGGPARTVASGSLAQAIAAAYHSPFSTGGAKFHDENYEGWVDTVPFGCWERRTLIEAGLFDEVLVRNQDDELNLRLIRAGGRIWQNPRIRCWYSPRASLLALFRQYFQYGFWKVAVIRKHRIPASWRHLVPAGFLLANAACILAIPFNPPWAIALWAVLLTAYAAGILVASVLTIRKAGVSGAFYLPAAFATFHLSYGLGFVAGVRWLFLGYHAAGSGDTTYTRLSR